MRSRIVSHLLPVEERELPLAGEKSSELKLVDERPAQEDLAQPLPCARPFRDRLLDLFLARQTFVLKEA